MFCICLYMKQIQQIPLLLFRLYTCMPNTKVEKQTFSMHGQFILNSSSRGSSSGSRERAYSNSLHMRALELLLTQSGKNNIWMHISRQPTSENKDSVEFNSQCQGNIKLRTSKKSLKNLYHQPRKGYIS